MINNDLFKKITDEYYTISQWSKENPNIVAGFTTKEGGFSSKYNGTLNFGFHVGDQLENVLENRNKFAQLIDFPLSTWVGAEQTHGVNIKKISSAHVGKGSMDYISSISNTDGLYTNTENVLLTLCFADCVPLYFYAPINNMIGVAHAGWKGTVSGIAKKMIELWENEGVRVDEIKVVIGPSICKDCYVVDNRVIDEAKRWINKNEEVPFNEISTGQFQLDLRKLNKIILEKTGVVPENIEITDLCTSCNLDFFSHRRDKGKTGRMISFIGMKGV